MEDLAFVWLYLAWTLSIYWVYNFSSAEFVHQFIAIDLIGNKYSHTVDLVYFIASKHMDFFLNILFNFILQGIDHERN